MVMTMNSSDQFKLDIILKLSQGKIKLSEACQLLDKSERQVRRYKASYEEKGVLFVKHGNWNKVPKNKIEGKFRDEAIDIVKKEYYDFNRTHAREKLKEEHGIVVKKTVFNRWCNEEKILLKKVKRKAKKKKQRRKRMSQKGLMVQMDGSPHKWFGGKHSCLIAAIDDADNEILGGEFTRSETTLDYLRILKKIVKDHGVFKVLYVDRAGVFGANQGKREGFSQVKRALNELGIQVVYANSAEAKGRIERLWDTLQDRLIAEMRIRGIKDSEEASRFLKDDFIPNHYNKKIESRKALKGVGSAFEKLSENIDLDEIFCIKNMRKVRNDNSINWKGYLLDLDYEEDLRKKQVEVREYLDGSYGVFYQSKRVKLRYENDDEVKKAA